MARILVIDDEASIQMLLRQILEAEGHEVSTASDGEEGLQVLNTLPIDLVFTDIFMPKKEGIEVIQLMRQQFSQVKIVAFSSETVILPRSRSKVKTSVLDAAQYFGAHRTLAKPFTLGEVIEIVNTLLSYGEADSQLSSQACEHVTQDGQKYRPIHLF